MDQPLRPHVIDFASESRIEFFPHYSVARPADSFYLMDHPEFVKWNIPGFRSWLSSGVLLDLESSMVLNGPHGVYLAFQVLVCMCQAVLTDAPAHLPKHEVWQYGANEERTLLAAIRYMSNQLMRSIQHLNPAPRAKVAPMRRDDPWMPSRTILVRSRQHDIEISRESWKVVRAQDMIDQEEGESVGSSSDGQADLSMQGVDEGLLAVQEQQSDARASPSPVAPPILAYPPCKCQCPELRSSRLTTC